ncbi:hypothetical protein PIB30_100335 [Stylosanthes scabra]|uniref:Uncharacterized protein n=1 Tax=Stylosanthes scabra TaxID=79078 RepID=A0ABU6ZVQ9_9FABA|nr:hypothetical protein [Stylosanthes scabra]
MQRIQAIRTLNIKPLYITKLHRGFRGSQGEGCGIEYLSHKDRRDIGGFNLDVIDAPFERLRYIPQSKTNAELSPGEQSHVGKKKASKLGASFKKAQNGAGVLCIRRGGSSMIGNRNVGKVYPAPPVDPSIAEQRTFSYG